MCLHSELTHLLSHQVMRLLKFFDGFCRLCALHCQPGVWKPAASDFGSGAPKVEGGADSFESLFDLPTIGETRRGTLDLSGPIVIEKIGGSIDGFGVANAAPTSIADLASKSDYLATTLLNGVSILIKALEITYVVGKLPSEKRQSVGNVSGHPPPPFFHMSGRLMCDTCISYTA